MTIDVILTAKIFKRFSFYDTFIRRKMWRSPALFAAIMCSCACIAFIMRHVDGAIFLGSVLMIVGLGMPATYFLLFVASLQKQVKAHGLTRPQKVYTLQLTKNVDGISVSNEKEHVTYRWDNVYHIYRDTLATYLFMSPTRGFILPHTCLEEGPDALWALIEKKLPAQKYTK